MAFTHNRFRTSGIDDVKSYTNIKKTVLLWTTISLVDEVWSWLVGLLQLHTLETLKYARRKWQTSANQRAVKDKTTFHNHYEPTTKAQHNRQLSPLLDAYAKAYTKQNPESGLLNLNDTLKQADQHKKEN